MILAFFEGPAGSGKTHQLVDAAVAAARALRANGNSKLLALTFMNGARQRLNARFSAVPALRGRFVCSTFDSFAALVVHRRRSVLRCLAQEELDNLSMFDRTCVSAAQLLEEPAVAAWVAAAYPVVVVDEAQDLDRHRFRILKALEPLSAIIAAADEFQNLNENVDTTGTLRWLRQGQSVANLTQIRRTSQDGLLRVAGALRSAGNVCGELTGQAAHFPCHIGPGFRMVQPPAKNIGSLAWAVADELSRMGDGVVVLTPDASGPRVRDVLARVQATPFNRNKKTGTTFGPYSLAWENREDDEADRLLDGIPVGDTLPLGDAIAAIQKFSFPERHVVCRRLERARNVRGETSITRPRLREIIEGALRDVTRTGQRQARGRQVMTIHRAKNREFGQVLVLWPHSASGSAEHQRRLLYNAITRAKDRCSVVVFGQNRTDKAPFAGS